MLAIKFKPIGKRMQRSYRVVVAEKRSKLKGRFIEDLGWYNPNIDDLNINKERTAYWIGVGAQPTDSVHNLLVKAGVISAPKRAVHSRKSRRAHAEASNVEVSTETSEKKEESAPKSSTEVQQAEDNSNEVEPTEVDDSAEKQATDADGPSEAQPKKGQEEESTQKGEASEEK